MQSSAVAAASTNTYRRLSREECKIVLQLYTEQRFSQREIAEQFNVSQSTISYIVANKGVSPYEKRKETLETKILALCTDHPCTLKELEDTLDIPVGTITAIIAKLPIRRFRKTTDRRRYFYTADLNHSELQQ